MKNKLMITLVLFLILIPLRLPISILFIQFFEWIVNVTATKEIPNNTLATNVIVSKVIYNIALSSYFVYNIEKFSIEKFGRRAKDQFKTEQVYWWTVVISILLFVFIIIDAVSINDIFFS